MSNISLVLAREYRQKVSATSFKVTTALGFVLILALAFAPAILDRIESATSGSTVAVVAPDESLAPALRSSLPEELPNGEPRTEIVAVQSADAAQEEIESGEYDGVLVPQGSGETSYVYRGSQPGSEADRLREALSGIATQQRLREAGLSREEAAGVFEPVAFEVEATGEAATGEERQTKFWLVYALVFILYFTVIQYGNMVAMSVIGEKSSRITEIMTASVRPFDQMAGKILGVGLLGLTQYAFWVGAGLISLLIGRLRGESGVEIAAVPPGTLALFVLFFTLGFLLYATILSGLGSLLSRTEDAQQLIGPVVMLMVGGLILAFVAMGNPDSTLAVAGSFVPFFSPMVMFTRAVLGAPPAWEVALSIALLAATVAAAVWAAARAYRVGVLMYGKRPSFAEVTRLVRQKPSEKGL